METMLVNGIEEAAPAVSAIRISLDSLLRERPIDFYEAVMVARDPSHVLWGNSGQTLNDYALLQSADGQMHSTVRNVILASTEGDDLDLRMVPLKQAA